MFRLNIGQRGIAAHYYWIDSYNMFTCLVKTWWTANVPLFFIWWVKAPIRLKWGSPTIRDESSWADMKRASSMLQTALTYTHSLSLPPSAIHQRMIKAPSPHTTVHLKKAHSFQGRQGEDRKENVKKGKRRLCMGQTHGGNRAKGKTTVVCGESTRPCLKGTYRNMR